MKEKPKDSDSLYWEQTMRTVPTQTKFLPKFMVSVIIFFSLSYVFYTFKLISSPQSCNSHHPPQLKAQSQTSILNQTKETKIRTQLDHIVFNIGASSKLWNKRKEYIKLWYKKNQTRAIVWLDKPIKQSKRSGYRDLPPMRISEDTSRFNYTHGLGRRSAIRISRIVSETVRLNLTNVRWIIMGDDDTVFVPDNLARVLNKYDHGDMYYIGSSSESHLQNLVFSYNMAFGGGGFAISYPLAKAIEKMQDRCLQRYPDLYGSDDRMHACMAELGVPLTKELGFHQFDVHGDVFGLLAAHPIAPLLSLHHLDLVEPILPNMNRVQALQHLYLPMKLDSAAILQQSICYDQSKSWTVSVSWGYAVQILRGILSPREMEMPPRTFLNWRPKVDFTGYPFNTRPQARNLCQKPFVYYLSSCVYDQSTNRTVSEYLLHRIEYPDCHWKMANPSEVERVEVHKRPDPYMWDKAPRRNCCRILPSEKEGTMVIDVGVCRDGEVAEVTKRKKKKRAVHHI